MITNEEIKSKFSNFGIELKNKGKSLQGRCPLTGNHPTGKESNFNIEAVGETFKAHCFGGCNQGAVFSKCLDILGRNFKDRYNTYKSPKPRNTPMFQPVEAEGVEEHTKDNKGMLDKWNSFKELESTKGEPYLKAKNIFELEDIKESIRKDSIRKDTNGHLAIPIMYYRQGEAEKLIGIEIINQTEQKFDKRSVQGSEKKGGSLILSTPVNNEPILLSEGFATAVTLREAGWVTAATCFGIDNMLNAAKVLQKAYPSNEVVCCPDTGTDNTAQTLRKEGFRVIVPDFAGYKPNNKQTDFNDLFSLAYNDKGDLYLAAKLIWEQLKAGLSAEPPKTREENIYSEFLNPYTLNDYESDIKQTPESIKSGLKIKDKDLLFPSAGITLLAGATGHGKTTLLIQAAINVLREYPEKKYLYITLEEGRSEVLTKFLVNIKGDQFKGEYPRTELKNMIRNGNLEPDFYPPELNRIRIASNKFEGVDSLIQGIEEAVRAEGKAIGGVFLDYAQLLKVGDGVRARSRQEELKEVCIKLKDLAVTSGLPLIIAAQFNREVTAPTDLHCTKLGEAGDLERIASLIIGLWNGNKEVIADKHELSVLNGNPYCYAEKIKIKKDQIFLKVLKNRNGESEQSDWLKFDGRLGTIKNKEIKEC
jgi:hypothetical protein